MSMLPHGLIVAKQLFLIKAAQRAFLSARLASAGTLQWTLMHSPWAAHQKDPNRSKFTLLLSDCFHCRSGALRNPQEGPCMLSGPLRHTCASYRAVDSLTALSVVQ